MGSRIRRKPIYKRKSQSKSKSSQTRKKKSQKQVKNSSVGAGSIVLGLGLLGLSSIAAYTIYYFTRTNKIKVCLDRIIADIRRELQNRNITWFNVDVMRRMSSSEIRADTLFHKFLYNLFHRVHQKMLAKSEDGRVSLNAILTTDNLHYVLSEYIASYQTSTLQAARNYEKEMLLMCDSFRQHLTYFFAHEGLDDALDSLIHHGFMGGPDAWTPSLDYTINLAN